MENSETKREARTPYTVPDMEKLPDWSSWESGEEWWISTNNLQWLSPGPPPGRSRPRWCRSRRWRPGRFSGLAWSRSAAHWTQWSGSWLVISVNLSIVCIHHSDWSLFTCQCSRRTPRRPWGRGCWRWSYRQRPRRGGTPASSPAGPTEAQGTRPFLGSILRVVWGHSRPALWPHTGTCRG